MLRLVFIALTVLVCSIKAGGHNPFERDWKKADAVFKSLKNYAANMEGAGHLREAIDRVIDIQKESKAMIDVSEEQQMEILEHYLKNYVKPNVGEFAGGNLDMDDMMRDAQQNYIQTQKNYGSLLTAGLRGNLISITQQFMEGGDVDEIKSLMIGAIRQSVAAQPMRPAQQFLYGTLFQLLMNPTDEHLKDLFAAALDSADVGDQSFIGEMALHLYKAPVNDHLKELLKEGIELVLTHSKVPTEYPLAIPNAVLQSIVSSMQNNDKAVVSFLLLSALLSMDDEYSSMMAGKFATFLVTKEMKPQDIPEDERRFWYPPDVCRMEVPSTGEVSLFECPHNMQCSIGPVSIQYNNTNQRITLCARPTDSLLFHACKISYTNGTVAFEQPCPQNNNCNVGTFRTQWNGLGTNVDLDAMYCENTLDYYYREPTIVDRACAVTNANGFVLGQRHCPEEYSCRMGPFEVPDTDDYSAWVCGEDDDTYTMFYTQVLGAFFGLSEDDMVGLAYAFSASAGRNMSTERDSSEADRQFMQAVLGKLNAISEKHEEMDGNMDADMVGLYILHYFVETSEKKYGSGGLAADTFGVLYYKQMRYGLDEADRKMLHRLIMWFVWQWKKYEQMQNESPIREMISDHLDDHHEKESGMGDAEGLMALLKAFGSGDKKDHLGDILEMLGKHKEAHSNDKGMEEMMKAFLGAMGGKGDYDDDKGDKLDAAGKLVLGHLMDGRDDMDFLTYAYKHLMSQGENMKDEKKNSLALRIMYFRIEEILSGEPLKPERRAEMFRHLVKELLGGDESKEEDMGSASMLDMMMKMMRNDKK